MRRILLAVLFFVALVAIWARLHSVILNEVKDLSKTLLVTLAVLAYATTSIVRFSLRSG